MYELFYFVRKGRANVHVVLLFFDSVSQFKRSELMGRTKKPLGEDVLFLSVLVADQAFDPKGNKQTVIIVNYS